MTLPSFLSIGFVGKNEFTAADIDERSYQHLRTRRLATGQRFLILDGNGQIFECASTDDKLQTFRLFEKRMAKPLTPAIELCVSPPKGDALWELVTQATEIGATSISFLRSEHNQYPKAIKAPPTERAQRVADAACEQCARPWRLVVHEGWHAIDQLLQQGNKERALSQWVADEALAGPTEKDFPNTPFVRLFVGPEGGWSATERQIFDEHQARRFSLGPLILRVPTAAVTAIHHLRWLSEHGR